MKGENGETDNHPMTGEHGETDNHLMTGEHSQTDSHSCNDCIVQLRQRLAGNKHNLLKLGRLWLHF